MENLLTVEEAAQTLNLREDTLKGCRIRRVWRIPESELRQLGNENSASGEARP